MKPSVTVLHIDDDPDTRFLLRELAADAQQIWASDMQIRWLESGGVEDAVAQFASVRPDVILLDHRLSGENGIELLPRILQVWKCQVWILTGFSHASVYERSREQGAAGVISKDELLQNAEQLQAFLAARCRLQHSQ